MGKHDIERILIILVVSVMIVAGIFTILLGYSGDFNEYKYYLLQNGLLKVINGGKG